MAQGIDENIKTEVEQTVDRIQAGILAKAGRLHRLGRPIRQPAGRKPIQLGVEDHQHQQPEDKDGNRVTDNTHDPDDDINPFILIHSGHDP